MIKLSVKISSGTIVYEKKRLKSVLRAAGNEVAAAARAKLNRNSGTGRKYYVRGSSGSQGSYQASVAGSPPSSITGKLARSIKVFPFKSGDGVAVRARAFYALFLEIGAKGGGGRKRTGANKYSRSGKRDRTTTKRVMLPRPFLSAVLDERSASIGQRISAAIDGDVKFKRLKA